MGFRKWYCLGVNCQWSMMSICSWIISTLFLLNEIQVTWEAFITPGKYTVGENERNISIGGINVTDRDDSKYQWSEGNLNINRQSVELNFNRITSMRRDSQLSLAESAESLSTFLYNFADFELGVNETKNIFESTSFEVKRAQSLLERAKSLADNFSMQIDSYREAIEKLVVSVKLLSSQNESLLLQKCCDLKPESFFYDPEYNMEIRKDTACWSAGSRTKSTLRVPSIFNEAMLKNSLVLPHLKWQYFVSPEGVYVEFPANNHNCKDADGQRPIFSPKTRPERKMWLIQKSKQDTRVHRIIFLINLARNPTTETIKSMKNIVLMLLRFLDEADEVGFLNVDPDEGWSDFLCDQLVPVTPWTRYQVLSYLNYIEHRYKMSFLQQQLNFPDDPSERDSVSALNKSFQMACANVSLSTLFPPSAPTIIHLTSGVDSNLTTLRVLSSPCPIFVESYFLKDLGKEEEDLYKSYFQGVSSKNIWNIQVYSSGVIQPESFAIKVALKLSSKKENFFLSDILSQFFPEEKDKSTTDIEFSLPHWNPIVKQPVIVAKKYVFKNGHPLGLVAVEIPIVDFTQHITYFVDENVCDTKNYAFLIDTKGRVITHPALGRPDTSEEVLSPIQIEQVEVYQGFSSLRRKLLSPAETSGCYSLRLRTRTDWVTYAWSRVDEYVVVIVAFGESSGCVLDREELVLRKGSLSPKSDIQHHLLLQKTHCCNHQEFSTSKAALYLSPSAFSKPGNFLGSHHLSANYNSKLSLALMAYLSDNSGLLQNQNKGLKLTLKDHIGILANILPMWKGRFRNSQWSKYIQKRFATAAGGTFLLVYPGMSITPGYVPYSSPWFRNAVSGTGKVMFSPPVLNSRGTPLSTLSVLVSANGPPELAKYVPVGVLGATVSVGFFQKLLEEMVPECKNLTRFREMKDNISIRCFLLDEAGHVIYHPLLARALQTLASVHITQIEPLSIIDILQNGQNTTEVPMRKETCHKLSETSATQESLQRFYFLSMSPAGIQKLKHGEICHRYHILPVPKTNLFLGIVQDNCSFASAFCPCSTVDNLCLNCLRIELSDCECPCECPREPNFCSKQGFTDLPENIEPCEFPPEPLSMERLTCGNETACHGLWIPCENITNLEDCVGVHDCEWCESFEVLIPQCKTFGQCYGFEEGRMDPRNGYNGFSVGTLPPDSSIETNGKDENETQITVVPILGVLGVFLFFLGLVFYCYRHRALRSSTSQPDVHLLPLQESPMGSIIPQAGSSRSNSDTEAEIAPAPLVYLRRYVRAHEQAIPPPPRSPLGSVFTESDHGYSTMTHNDDSESGAPVSLVYLEPPPVPQLIEASSQSPPITTITQTNVFTEPRVSTVSLSQVSQ